MITIAVTNQKGGCGKTTTAINVAAGLGIMGYRVLLVDLDPQAHATIGLGYEPSQLERTATDLFINPHQSIDGITLSTQEPGLSLIPSNVLLGTVEIDLVRMVGKELILAEQLRQVSGQYDYCILDCAPPLTILMLNAFIASQYVTITVQTQYLALEGLKRLLETIRIIKKRFHPCSVETLGLVLTFVEDRTSLCRQIQQQLREYFGPFVFNTVIHRNVRLAEAPSAGKSIFRYSASSKGAYEYRALAEEVTQSIEHRNQESVVA